MTVYKGPPPTLASVSLSEPGPAALRAALDTAELEDEQKRWFDLAQADRDSFYFTVRRDGELIGQIFLHDIDHDAGESLVGYHLFLEQHRGKGYGTLALKLLCAYAFEQLGLRRLVAITELDNVASRRVAVKAGFREIGPAYEGPHLVAYEAQRL